jgi:DNA-binding transcriptional LysR family regulator
MITLPMIGRGYLNTMELHQLRYFEAVARHLHFTRAAEELHVAQPSVSQQLRKLEAELGTSLFHRMKRRVTLTSAGETFLPRARLLLAELEQARAEVQELAGLRKGTLAIGATPSVSTHLLPGVLAEFHRRHPGISLVLREAGSRWLVQSLESGELDLAVVILPVRQPILETQALLEERLMLAVPLEHPLAGRETVELRELRGAALVMFREDYDLRDVTMAACRRLGFEPEVAIEGGEMDTVLRLVAAGLGVAIVPEMAIEAGAGLVAVSLERPRLSRTIALARRRDRYLSAAAREFSTLLGSREQRWRTNPSA